VLSQVRRSRAEYLSQSFLRLKPWEAEGVSRATRMNTFEDRANAALCSDHVV